MNKDKNETESFKKILGYSVIIVGLVLFLSILQPWNWGGSEKETATTQEVGITTQQKQPVETGQSIKLKPDQHFTLEISSDEWSPWLDGSHSGMYYNVNLKADRIYQFLDGSIKKAKKGESIKLEGNVFRLKTQTGSKTALVRTSMNPINKDIWE